MVAKLADRRASRSSDEYAMKRAPRGFEAIDDPDDRRGGPQRVVHLLARHR